MQITNLQLRNFRCFEKMDLEFGDLTVLTGANSSGKSSIMSSLLAAIQTDDFPINYSPNGRYVELGDFDDIVFKRDKNRKLEIGFQFTVGNSKFSINTKWCEKDTNKLPELCECNYKTNECNIQINKQDSKYYFDLNINTEKIDHKSNELFLSMIKFINTNLNKNDKAMTFIDQGKSSLNRIHIDNIHNIRKEIPSNNVFATLYYQEFATIVDLLELNINYISSFRLHPLRTYSEQMKSDLKIGRMGENYTDQIINWESENPTKFNELINVMKRFKLFENIRSNRLNAARYEILVSMKQSGIETALSDVGFGVSQFLPIIVADLQTDDKTTLFLSQPEIHLHPSAQAEFAEYICENIKNKKKRYVIETHSEYFINRLRLLIVNEILSPDKIKVYHCVNDGVLSDLRQIQFKKNGSIQGDTKDFFDTYLIDIKKIVAGS